MHIKINSKEDLLKYSTQQLRSEGILVQIKTYKRTRGLPLKNGEKLQIQAGQEVCFFKLGPEIYLATKGKVYDPYVEPEHVGGIFKDYSPDEIFISSNTDLEFQINRSVNFGNVVHSISRNFFNFKKFNYF